MSGLGAGSRARALSTSALQTLVPRPETLPSEPTQTASSNRTCLALNFGLCWSLLLVQPEDTWFQGGFPAGTSQGSCCLTSGSPGWHRKDSAAQASSTQRPSPDQTGLPHRHHGCGGWRRRQRTREGLVWG